MGLDSLLHGSSWSVRPAYLDTFGDNNSCGTLRTRTYCADRQEEGRTEETEGESLT